MISAGWYNARRSKVRAAVERVFAGQKHRMGLAVRTIGIARATIKTGMANLVYISSASHGSKAELRLHNTKTGPTIGSV